MNLSTFWRSILLPCSRLKSVPWCGADFCGTTWRHITEGETLYSSMSEKLQSRLLKFLVNDQCEAQFFFMYLFIFLTLYTFRVHRAHHQERKIVSIQPLVAVGGRVVCRSEVKLPTCTRHGHQHRVTAPRGFIDTVFLSWWRTRCARNT